MEHSQECQTSSRDRTKGREIAYREKNRQQRWQEERTTRQCNSEEAEATAMDYEAATPTVLAEQL